MHERIISDAMKGHLRFADDIGVLDEEGYGLEALVQSFDKICIRFKTEVSDEKTTPMTLDATEMF